jgi:hypothetical protein
VEKLVQVLLDQKFRGALSLEYEGGDPVNASKACYERIRQAVKKVQPA